VASANLVAFAGQQTLQHSAAGERILQMQLVHPAHQLQIGI
jgi:hypothetical protein